MAVGAWLAFGFFGVHTLFIDERVDEAAPTFEPAPGDRPEPATADAMDAAMDAAMEAEGVPERVESTEPAPAMPTVVVAGAFTGRSHPTSGRAVVLTDGSDRRVLRLEDFATDNGPDLNVYLSAAPPDAPAEVLDDDVVDLGDLKGNLGNQNYEIPPGVDLSHHRTVVIWCVRFKVAFGTAPLEAP